jgi:hypothetical protein
MATSDPSFSPVHAARTLATSKRVVTPSRRFSTIL